MKSRSRLILIEGLPGSGKTSLAEWLCARIEARGVNAAWIPELQPDHPVIDRPTMRTARATGYGERCVDRWRAFSNHVQARESPEVLIAEGCLFQGTVRFLIEYERSADEIDGYLASVEECIAPLHPHLVYLTQTDVGSYLRREFAQRKGEAVVSRISSYSAGTPFAAVRGLEEDSALVALYATYRGVCDRLVQDSTLPVLEIDAVRFGETAVRDRVMPWVAAAVAG
jgi:hypothetical protein